MSGDRKIIETGYNPRPLQAQLHLEVKRFNVIVCHRRFGKTVWGLNHMIDHALRNPLPNPQYAYLAPFFGQAKRVAWDYLKMYAGMLPGASINEADLRVDIHRPNGDRVRIMLLGADNPVSLKGLYLDGVILDEYGEMNPMAWREVIRPTLSDRHTMNPECGWAIFVGTPKGQNHFHSMWEFAADPAANPDIHQWFRRMFKASETGIIPEPELRSNRAIMSEEEYEQEFECSFSAGQVGAYYAKLMAQADTEGRIGAVPYDPALPVTTAWDLGIGDTTSIWFFQQVGPWTHAIDYIETSGVGLDFYARELQKRRYIYGKHLLPHDAAAKDLSLGTTRQQHLYSLGVSPAQILPKTSVEDRIGAARMLIPKMRFDREKCRAGIRSLQNYSRDWDGKMNTFRASPRHDWASHGADSFGYGAQGLARFGAGAGVAERNLAPKAITDYDVFTHSHEENW